jgi:phosphatidylinositol glycan class V
MLVPARPLDHPIRNLSILFVSWKVLLLLIAAFSPGPGYDTSTTLYHQSHGDGLPLVLRYMLNKLTRWDAIYFIKVATRGYQFEQEWAFGWGFTRFIKLCTACKMSSLYAWTKITIVGLETIGVPHYHGLEGLVAIVIAHISHLLSVLVLFSLTSAVFPNENSGFRFTAAFFQIISPAGLFLSAPFAESSCAALSFAGILLFSKSFNLRGRPSASQDLLVVISGILFGIATTFRSNGILNGLLLLEEAIINLLKLQHNLNLTTLRRIAVAGVGGMCVGIGFMFPQYVAYSEYCNEETSRPWCRRTFPSIYTFVQDHYWYTRFPNLLSQHLTYAGTWVSSATGPSPTYHSSFSPHQCLPSSFSPEYMHSIKPKYSTSPTNSNSQIIPQALQNNLTNKFCET